MKIFYFNDEQKDVTVRVLDDRFDPMTGEGDIYTTLSPASGQVFEVQAPAGSVLYVKKWKDLVLISYIDQLGLAQLEQLLPNQVAR
jgi:hypothetical protein